jgi:hypothetical protein
MTNYPTIWIGETIRIVNIMQSKACYPLYQIQEKAVKDAELWFFWDGLYSDLQNAIAEVERVLHVKV